MKIVNFKNEKSEVISKRATGIISISKNLLYLLGKIENKSMKDQKHRKVRDHYEYTRKYKGAAHSIRNLKYSVP